MISADQMLDDVRQLLNVVPHEARKRTIMSRAYYAAYHFLLKHACCRTYVRTPGVGSHRDLLNFLGRSPELNVRHAASVLGDLYARRITADYRIDNHILEGLEKRCVEDAAEVIEEILVEYDEKKISGQPRPSRFIGSGRFIVR